MLALVFSLLLHQAPAPAKPTTVTPPAAAAKSEGAEPLDFTDDVKLLFRVVACAGDAELPANLDQKVLAAHCKEIERRANKYRATWVKEAEPFIASQKPAGLPTTVVYPFGGGDLLSALTTYPDAKDITTMSLEHAGDPRRVRTLDSKQLAASLQMIRATSSGLLVANDSKTENMMKVQRGDIPGQLAFFLLGLMVHGYEPVSLKYFKLNADGTPHYITADDLKALEKKEAHLLKKEWVAPDFSEAFDNLELVFVKHGEDPKTQARVHRHFAENMDDDHFGKDEPMKAYLSKKGQVVAMTKAASYLLWRDNFSTIRTWLLAHMEFMVSDSTGIPPKFATRAGFEQQAYGKFAESFLPASEAINEDFVELWKHARKLGFRYGYLDKNLSMHMLITYKPGALPPAPEPKK